MTQPVLVTLTSPTAGGKSYLLNYIRDEAKLPCLVSTTTRAPRVGEVEGVDYYFISEEKSKEMELNGEFAELATYNEIRYGVTKTEYHSKLAQGICFLVVEPSGIESYAQPAKDAGALHFKVYVHTDPEIRIARFKERFFKDLNSSIFSSASPNMFEKTFNSYMTRFQTMFTQEMKWGDAAKWDQIVFGNDTPDKNLDIILTNINKMKAKLL